jgi:hypothetical protein
VKPTAGVTHVPECAPDGFWARSEWLLARSGAPVRSTSIVVRAVDSDVRGVAPRAMIAERHAGEPSACVGKSERTGDLGEVVAQPTTPHSRLHSVSLRSRLAPFT